MEEDEGSSCGVTCGVAACPNNFTSGNEREDLTYHRFPQNAIIKAAWVKACMRPRDWPGADSAYVCSDHFDDTDFDFQDADPLAVCLKPDAIPSSRIKLNIKAEPIDVEEEFGNMMDEESFEMHDDESNDAPAILDEVDTADNISFDGSYQSRGNNQCKNCTRHFKTEARLRRHETFCLPTQKKSKPGPRASSGTPCFYKCGAKFYHRNKMLKHMELVHHCIVDPKQRLKFANMDEFWMWKENEEERTYSYFSKRTGNHKNTAMYHCQRDGPSRARPSDPSTRAGKRQLTKGNIKENIICLAHIKTILNQDGTVTAVYFPSHNHPLSAMDYLHHPLSRTTQNFIKEKLELGYTPKQIADELLTRQKASGGDNPLSKNQFLHMVNKLDRIRGILDRERKRQRDETIGSTFVRKRRSRKAIFEEQFEKSRKYQEQVQAVQDQGKSEGSCEEGEREQNEEDEAERTRKTMSFIDALSDVRDEQTRGTDEEEQNVDDDLAEADLVQESSQDVTGDLMAADELMKTLTGATAMVCKKEDVVRELVLDESGVASSADSSDYRALYMDSVLEIRKLNESVEILKKKLVRKEKQMGLLVNALKKALTRESLGSGREDLASLKETVSDGDYEIIVI